MNLEPRLLRQAHLSRRTLALTVGLGFAGGVLTVLQARALTGIIGDVFLREKTLAGVSGGLWALAALIVLRAAVVWGGELSASAAAAQVKRALRQRLFDHLLALGPAYARRERTGELTGAAMEGIEALDAYFSQYLPQLALSALVPLTFLLFVFPLDLISGLVLLVTAPLIPLFMILIGSAAQALTRRQWQSLSRMSAYFLDVLQGLAALKMLGRSREQAGEIERVSGSFRVATLNVLRVTFLSALALEMLSTLSTAVVAVQVGLRLLYGRLAFDQAFFVLLLAPEFYLPLRLLGARFHAGMSGVAAAKRIFEILETPLEQAGERGKGGESGGEGRGGGEVGEGGGERSGKFRLPSFDLRHPPSVRFDEVRYTYRGDRPALDGVSFEIQPGEIVALVGPSGAGKSTVAGLLLRFLSPSGGRIHVSGLPLESIPPQEWRAHVGWVPQHPHLFNDTVAANIRLGRPEAGPEQVVEAARRAHADEFIRRLPQGYDTPIGERGARLSGGQAQRIALARAFLKDAPLLVLDEPAAGLDPELEALLADSTQKLLAGRSALVIAHRLGTVAAASRIVVLDGGRVVESGTHAGLLRQDGLYASLAGAGQGAL